MIVSLEAVAIAGIVHGIRFRDGILIIAASLGDIPHDGLVNGLTFAADTPAPDCRLAGLCAPLPKAVFR